LHRPEAAADEPLGGGDAPEHVDEQADGVVCDVGGVDRPRVGDGDAAARALVEVDVVNARAGAEDEADGRDGVEERCVHAGAVSTNDDRGASGVGPRRGGGEESGEGLAQGVEVEDAVLE